MNASRLLAASALIGIACTAPALAGPSLVVDAATGAVLSAEDPTRAWHPASTTKMMTLYVALKALREGRIGLETAIPASPLAAKQPRVKAYIKAGQEVTLDNAMRIMMVKSANDIAYVIAEGVGGTVDNFVSLMNAEARRLGMRDSYFVNPNGWHHSEQQTSARDLAVLAMALMREFPDYAEYWNTPAVQLGKTLMNNTNGLVGRYPGVNGFKTGYVCASGFNVVATAQRGGRTLIAVVLGSYSGAERTVKAAQLLDAGFSAWGGFGQSVSSLPAGTGGRASSICDQVRNRGGGAPLADDADVAGPISASQSAISADESVSDRFRTMAADSYTPNSVLTRSASGRVVLGPRSTPVPVPVAFGRTPASDRAPLAANVAAPSGTQVARTQPVLPPSAPVAAGLVPGPATQRTASSNGAIPSSTSAFAPAERLPTDGPLRLQGAVQPGAATATSLRPGAAAGFRQNQRNVQQSRAKPSQPAVRPPVRPAQRPKPKPATN